MEWAHLLKCQLPNAAKVMLELNIFVIPRESFIVQSASLLCCLEQVGGVMKNI